MTKKESIKHFISGRKGQIIFNYLYSWGAAVVIIGAMFKIIHLHFADYILMAGMITEAMVFFISAFDHITPTTETETASNAGVLVGGSFTGGAVVAPRLATVKEEPGRSKVEGAGPAVIIAGGGNATGGGFSGLGSGAAFAGNDGAGANSKVSAETFSADAGRDNSPERTTTPEYAQSLTDTAQNLEEFSITIQSLNEASRKLLTACKQVTETQGFADNLATLNQNVSGLNEVFNTQLQTITEQMSAIRYINDSLIRMKNLYDGAIGDSYMFREESAKMTRHIEALNTVYARLLQAMTTNNNNMNPGDF
ncbi:MAG: gliding motility protein GldL [Prevotella sp.]|jgi:uncharacterized protein YukE|nr:gliding motility protein GldL [Prevotella sp.]